MGAYSIDLRERVISLKERGETSLSISKLLKISTRSVDRYWRRKIETGSIVSDKIGGYKVSRLTPHGSTLRAWLKASPEITLDEIAHRCSKEIGVNVGITVVWRMLNRMGLTFKKNDTRQRARQRGCQTKTRSVETKPTSPRRKKTGVS